MFKPFQIRDLDVSPVEENLYDSSTDSVVSRSPVDDTRRKRHGTILLSAGEYDEIASDHPRALLTYMDDDDGDIITVGSSFELGQRLDEVAEPASPTHDTAQPMHLFDIRRSQSVTELWKAFGRRSASQWKESRNAVSPSHSDKDCSKGETLSESLESSPATFDVPGQWVDSGNAPGLSTFEFSKTEEPNASTKTLVSDNSSSFSRRVASVSLSPSPAVALHVDRKGEEAFSSSRSATKWTGLPTEIEAPNMMPNKEISPEPQNIATNSETACSPSIQFQNESEPLLSAFEAEIAKMLEEKASQSVDEQADLSSSRRDNASQTNTPHNGWPSDLVTNILQGVVSGIEGLGAELRSKVPEVERHLMNAQRAIPDDIGSKARGALEVVESQIRGLAQVLQNASDASGQAAERVRQAELHSANQVISGLGDMAQGFEDFSKTLFAAFEAEFGRDNNMTSVQPEAAIGASTNQDHPQSTVVDKEASELTSNTSSEPKNAESVSEINTSQVRQQESHDTPVNPVDVFQRPVPPYPLDVPRPSSKPISMGQSFAPDFTSFRRVPEMSWYSNWPNRPAFIPSAPRTAPYSSELSHSANARESQPMKIPSTEPSSRNDNSTNPAADVQQSTTAKDSLFIGNVGYQVTEQVIEEVFASKGISAQIHLPKDSLTGRHVGFGYARLQSSQCAKAALEKLQGIIIDGHSINLEYSDNSPIDQSSLSERTTTFPSPNFTADHRAHHRQSWHPGTRSREQSFVGTASSDDLPKVFSGNSRGGSLRNHRRGVNQTGPFVERSVLLGHPEESPEFAARYPSLLPTRSMNEVRSSMPQRSMSFSPDAEMARFPPVSQLDAHLRASEHRFKNGEDHSQNSLGPVVAPPSPKPHTERPEPARLPNSHQQLSRRTTIGPIRNSTHGTTREQLLRRRATEAHSLRLRAHENPLITRRPSSQDRFPRALPGSFPDDDTPGPVSHDSNDSSDQAMRTALRQSIIDNCVDNLAVLGYGTALDGGRQRLNIYAEAVDGKLSEAIDMIEEERSVYERRSSLN